MTKPRITFDRSAFHGQYFEASENSLIKHLANKKAISISHTPVFLDETISMYLEKRNREDLKRQLPFILEICNSRWFRRAEEVWVKELVERCGEKESILMPELEQKSIEERLNWFVLKDGLSKKFLSKAKKTRSQHKMEAEIMREALKESREDISNKLREGGKKLKDFGFTIDEFINRNIDELGKSIIVNHLNTKKDRIEIFQRWSNNKIRYPFFTTFVRGLLCANYFAMIEHNDRIDINFFIDNAYLMYLHKIDVFISNDLRFQKKAFDVLYQKQDKYYLTTTEFISFLNRINLSS